MKKITLAYGNFNPPTKEDLSFLEALHIHSQKENSKAFLALSKLENSSADFKRTCRILENVFTRQEKIGIISRYLRHPLSYSKKKEFLEKIIKENNYDIEILDYDDELSQKWDNILLACTERSNRNIDFIVDSTGLDAFKKVVENYNGRYASGLQVSVNFIPVTVESSYSVKSESIRYAATGDFSKFAEASATKNKELAWDIYQEVIEGLDTSLKIKEEPVKSSSEVSIKNLLRL